MRAALLTPFLLLAPAATAFAQQTADKERTGRYAPNPWSVAVIAIPLLALILIGAFPLLRRRL